jgi:hypothetical protein
MSQMSSKLEQVLEFLVNGENDKAQDLLHDAIVEKAREIHEEIVNTQEATDTVEETETNESTEETTEAKSDDDAEKVEETEEVDETVGGTGDSEEDLKAELKQKAEEDADEIDYEQTNEEDHDEEADGEAEVDAEEVEDLKDKADDIEDALEELKAKFNELIGNTDEDESEEEMPADEEMPAEESAEQPLEEAQLKAVNVAHADGSDSTKSPVAGAPKENANGAAPVATGKGGEEKGGQAPKPGNMGATTEPKMSEVKADHTDGSDKSAKSPVASK